MVVSPDNNQIIVKWSTREQTIKHIIQYTPKIVGVQK